MSIETSPPRAPLISPEDLAARLEAGNLAVVEILAEPSQAGAHIPGAVATTLHSSLALPRPGRHLDYDLPSATEFAAAMGNLGLTAASPVVFADEALNRWATRAFWLLRYYGHTGEVLVLDGGLAAYRRLGLPSASSPATAIASEYPVPEGTDESIRITADDLATALAAGNATACDVRTEAEFSGAQALSGRAGHLPGAIHVGWELCLGPDGRFVDAARLRQVLAPYLGAAGELVTYCQGGIRASLTWFALSQLLGRPARLYAASWEEWAQRPDLPVEM